MKKHNCLENLKWNETPIFDGENVIVKAKCVICNKGFEEVYTPAGIWDIEKEEYAREY